jgi:hypothetical protein
MSGISGPKSFGTGRQTNAISSSGVLGTGSPQQQLRHLAAVHGQIVNLALAQIDAHARRTYVENRRGPRDRHVFLDARWLDLEVQRQFLPNRQRHCRVLDGSKAILHRLDGVAGRLQVTDQEVPLIVREGIPLFTRALVFDRHLRTADERAALSRTYPLILP